MTMPVTGKRPAVLVIHAREGMTDNTIKNVEMFAKLGYVGFAADIFGYGQGVLPKDVPEMQAQTTMYNKDRALMKARTQAGYDVLAKHSAGRCRKDRAGRLLLRRHGRRRVRLYRRAARGHIAIHGSFDDHQAGWAKNVKGKYADPAWRRGLRAIRSPRSPA